MGLDGGTYITRSDVLRGQSWALASADNSRSTRGGNVSASAVFRRSKLGQQAEKATRWSTCALSGEPLAAPIAADFLGNLYNRQAVIEYLLARAAVFVDDQAEHRFVNQLRRSDGAFDHLRSAKDIFTVHLTEPSVEHAAAEDGAATTSRFMCPVTMLPCDRYPTSAISTCGHVFSDRALRQVQGGLCGTCSTAFQPEDLVPLISSPEQVEKLKGMLQIRQKKRASKKRKARPEPIMDSGQPLIHGEQMCGDAALDQPDAAATQSSSRSWLD